MSISYHGVPRRDRQLVIDVLEGRGNHDPIDEHAVRAALKQQGFSGPPYGSLAWEGDGGYVTVDVSSHRADVTHGIGGGDDVVTMVMLAIEILQDHGLHIWDPQWNDWYPDGT